jgi:predicted RNase H-like HicB family nuclease
MNTDRESARREYTVLYEQGPGSWGASVPDLPGCFAVGKTFEETETLIREAIELYIEQLRADGKPVPDPVTRAGRVSVAA